MYKLLQRYKLLQQEKTEREKMNNKDRNLVRGSEIIDTVMRTILGKTESTRRLLNIDYNEQGKDEHEVVAFWQNGMSDSDMVEELLKAYTDQGKKISGIVELSPIGNILAILYIDVDMVRK